MCMILSKGELGARSRLWTSGRDSLEAWGVEREEMEPLLPVFSQRGFPLRLRT